MTSGVIFDFHNTLVHADSLQRWLLRASEKANEPAAAVDQILPVLRSVWGRAARRYPRGAWDLDPATHRRAFEDVLALESPCSTHLAAALYDTMPDQWVAVDGATELLEALSSQGMRLAVVSNIALDIRPRLEELGMLSFLDVVVLSFEAGMVKPDPRIFEIAAHGMGLRTDDCVMVGDSPTADGGAVHAGMSALLVPVVDDMPLLAVATRLLARR